MKECAMSFYDGFPKTAKKFFAKVRLDFKNRTFFEILTNEVTKTMTYQHEDTCAGQLIVPNIYVL